MSPLLGPSGQLDTPPYSGVTLRWLVWLNGVGVAGILLFSLRPTEEAGFATIASTGLMLAGASLLIGMLLGFLFGIPRTLQGAGDAGGEDEDGGGDGKPAVAYRVNTNLEQISDWLTKILVGVGLTQFGALPAKLQAVSAHFEGGLGGPGAGAGFGLALVLFFLTSGFLLGYLWTRLHLSREFRKADTETIGSLRRRVEKTEQRLEERARHDAIALALTDSYLNPTGDAPPTKLDDLQEAIRGSSPSVKVQVFQRASKIRSENWNTDKAKMASTIPLFRALIEADPEGLFHSNYGQLGFALKDQVTPEWAEAKAMLDRAIELRGDWEEKGWLFYEFNRAICSIQLDEGFQAQRASKAETKQAILDDLRTASNSPELYKLLAREETVRLWKRLNKVTGKDYRP